MTARIIPVILSGGAGTRLWPMSRDALPKQFHQIIGAQTMIEATLARVTGAPTGLSFAAPIIMANARHREPILEILDRAQIEPAICLEPEPRNTAPAIAAAACAAHATDPDALVLVLPADHVIRDVDAFHAAIVKAARFAKDRIVTFAVKPDRPAVEYGYIGFGARLSEDIFEIEAFKEKPDAATAAHFIAGGKQWNAGIFLFYPEVIFSELSEAFNTQARLSFETAARDGAWIHLNPVHYARLPAEPFDVAIMEKTRRGAVVACDIGWADVGAWDEVWRLSLKDENGNVFCGDVASVDVANSLVRTDGQRVCVLGLSDLIVVVGEDGIIIAPKSRAQDVRLIASMNKSAN